MNKIIQQLNIEDYALKRKLVFGAFFCLGFLVLVYVYLVNNTILNIVQRKDIETKITYLNSKISEMESNLISLKNNTSIEYAYSVGFSDVKSVKFASRKLPNQTLSVNLGLGN